MDGIWSPVFVVNAAVDAAGFRVTFVLETVSVEPALPDIVHLTGEGFSDNVIVSEYGACHANQVANIAIQQIFGCI